MANYALEAGQRPLAAALHDCAGWLLFRHYIEVDDVRLRSANFCKRHLLCQFCAAGRAKRASDAYRERVDLVLAGRPNLLLVMVTLTVRNDPELSRAFRTLRAAIRRMFQARRDHLKAPGKNGHVEACKALGGVFSIEVKRGARSGLWHPHVHMAWLCERMPDSNLLSQEWERWTGGSNIVDVRPMYDRQTSGDAFSEIFKYALKFGDMTESDTWHAYSVVGKQRLIDSFGLLRGVAVPDSLADDHLEGLLFVDLLYKWKSQGYQLVRVLSDVAALCAPQGHDQAR